MHRLKKCIAIEAYASQQIPPLHVFPFTAGAGEPVLNILCILQKHPPSACFPKSWPCGSKIAHHESGHGAVNDCACRCASTVCLEDLDRQLGWHKHPYLRSSIPAGRTRGLKDRSCPKSALHLPPATGIHHRISAVSETTVVCGCFHCDLSWLYLSLSRTIRACGVIQSAVPTGVAVTRLFTTENVLHVYALEQAWIVEYGCARARLIYVRGRDLIEYSNGAIFCRMGLF